MTQPIENFRLRYALGYAAIGWSIFPLHWPMLNGKDTKCSCRKESCTNVGKHPKTTDGFKSATTDRAVIEKWWSEWPSANIGVATGAVSGIVVVDVDTRHGGDETLGKLMDEHGQLPETVEANTGGGGSHLVFAHPGVRIQNQNGGVLGAGLDVRGDGGYIVAAPSLHKSGLRYEWREASSPRLVKTAMMPPWLLSMLVEKPKPPAVMQPREFTDDERARHWLGKALAKTSAGNRNEVGLYLACQLRDIPMSESEARQYMRDYAQRVPQGGEPYSEQEALATLASAYSRPSRDPAKSDKPRPSPVKVAKATVSTDSASVELESYLMGVASGEILNAPWPWDGLTRLTQALIPGTITTVCGDPSVGKTFFILQCIRFWMANDIPSATFFIEKNRRFHMMRLLAQLEHSSDYLNYEWLNGKRAEVKSAMARNAGMIDELGKVVYSSDEGRVTLDYLSEWLTAQAEAKTRVIVIDPITAAYAGKDRWEKDDEFMMQVQHTMTKHGASLVLVTHPKGQRNSPTGHDQAGGAAYFRFADSTIWLRRPKKPRRVTLQTRHGPLIQTPPIFFEIHKSRNAYGTGKELAYDFGHGMEYAEQGLVDVNAKPVEEEDD